MTSLVVVSREVHEAEGRREGGGGRVVTPHHSPQPIHPRLHINAERAIGREEKRAGGTIDGGAGRREKGEEGKKGRRSDGKYTSCAYIPGLVPDAIIQGTKVFGTACILTTRTSKFFNTFMKQPAFVGQEITCSLAKQCINIIKYLLQHKCMEYIATQGEEKRRQLKFTGAGLFWCNVNSAFVREHCLQNYCNDQRRVLLPIDFQFYNRHQKDVTPFSEFVLNQAYSLIYLKNI